MRIVFAGTPAFSVNPLHHLIHAGHEVVCVYTQPDKKTGRGQKIIPPAVKICAEEHHIPVWQPTSLSSTEEAEKLAQWAPDLMVVVAYGMLLPQKILDIPKHGCLNIHASLLPKWRGAAPIQRAIESGDTETGVCIMQMDAGLDTGDIILQDSIPIEKDDTSASLHDKLSELGANTLMQAIELIQADKHHATPQQHSLSSYAKKISKQEANIDWTLSSQQIDCRIRAFNPWPVCQTQFNNKRVRIWLSENLTPNALQKYQETMISTPPGTILDITPTGIIVNCGQGAVGLKTLQVDGGKPLDHQQFINGHTITIGSQFVS